ncbi:hypothetical protein [Pseudoalteromonas maricaloris]|uniref:hypothetical protein n=1 Tax=Pseudoalteromonas maricaloris TaxID=184924 RepID=UPI003C18E52A
MNAYNIEILKQSIDDKARFDGWVFGLPPGIKANQWPLDPHTGYPLKHSFTLKLPEGYRTDENAFAVSFFAIAVDHNDGGPEYIDGLEEALFAEQSPDEPLFKPFWQAMQTVHPSCKFAVDTLDCYYATLLLSEAEFYGELCSPPTIIERQFEDDVCAPEWLVEGGASCFWKMNYSQYLSLPAEEYQIYRELGGIPPEAVSFNRAIALVANPSDPNAGKTPSEYEDTGYIDPYEGDPEWLESVSPNHLGGTSLNGQGIPDFLTPYYIEFEEILGGHNFGGGIGMLDLVNREFDWSCG